MRRPSSRSAPTAGRPYGLPDVGDSVVLSLAGPARGLRVQCRVEEVGPAALSLWAPGLTAHAPLPGHRAFLSWWRDFAYFAAPVRILRQATGPAPGILVTKPSADKVQRRPRRDRFRVPTRIEGQLYVPAGPRNGRFPVLILDLSTKGCRIELAQGAPPPGSPVLIDFDVVYPESDGGPLVQHALRNLPGRVCRVLPAAKGEAGETAGISFNGFDPADRRAVDRFVTYCERQLIQRGFADRPTWLW